MHSDQDHLLLSTDPQTLNTTLALLQNGQTAWNASTGTISRLQQLATAHRPGSAQAQAWLGMIGQGSYAEEVLLPTGHHAPVLPRKERPHAHFHLLEAFPNPATDQAYLVYQVPEGAEHAELRVVNALGQLVQEQNLPLNNRIVELNVKGVASGPLACSLYVDGRFLSSVVLNVIK